MVPEGGDEAVERAVGGGDGEGVANDVIGGDGDDPPGDGIFAPVGEGVLIELLDLGGVVIVRAGREGLKAQGVVYDGRDGGQGEGFAAEEGE